MRVRYKHLSQKCYSPRQPGRLGQGLRGFGHFFLHVAGCKSPSILDFERQYLMEPDGLRHGEVSAAVASSLGVVRGQ